ncbi:tRNA pseudouridine synthase A [Clostridia bacterium]|nr:tRNA pseudouridine synthase A [Clostridia bacterium]
MAMYGGNNKKRVALTVSYEGTNYHGWQIQKNGISIQQVLTEALSKLCQEKISVIGASRTDAGVHAMGNVAIFDTYTQIPMEKFALAINTRLPDDIVVQEAKIVASNFHPHHCPCRKTYVYTICNRIFPLPLQRNQSYFYPQKLNEEKMKEAAQYLLGEHDFTSFVSVKSTVENKVRIIFQIKIKREQDYLSIIINGNGFLYNMVRILAGSLLEVGAGKKEPIWIKEVLFAKNREKAGKTLPPQGLCLLNIQYDEFCKLPSVMV